MSEKTRDRPSASPIDAALWLAETRCGSLGYQFPDRLTREVFEVARKDASAPRSAPVRLFTLEGLRRRDPAVERWFDSRPPELRATARTWFDAMRSCGPEVGELLHDGCPTACVEGLAFGYVNAFRSHVNVGFFLGTSLEDPAGLLQGDGRFMRHVKVRPGMPVDERPLRALIIAAYRDIRTRAAAR
jgi:hypothetical protein